VVIELEHFGWNVLTISFIIVLPFSFVAAWGLWDQIKKIWKKPRTGEAVSNIFFISGFALFSAGLIYGLEILSIAVIVNAALRAPLHIPILIGLARFKGFAMLEWAILGLIIIALVVMSFVPWKGVFFLVIAVASTLPIAAQPLEIWKKKTSGVVSITFLVTHVASTTAWGIYALAIGDVFIFTFTAIAWLLFVITIVLWCKFRPRAHTA
jgi:uncharacterized protein with PQ loop repeat